MSDFNILIVGCGELGSRHLQAVASLPRVSRVEVVDARPEALEVAKSRLKDLPNLNPSIQFRWLNSLEQATREGDLCIVATQAKGRARLVMEIAERLGFKRFILEKIVEQSLSQYETLLQFSKAQGLSVWVNFKTRTYLYHKRIKELLKEASPITFSVLCGNHGLANSGIHLVDLFVFYDHCRTLQKLGSNIDAVLHPTKRGLYDLSGQLQIGSEKGSILNLSYDQKNMNPPLYSIVAKDHRFVFDHAHTDSSKRWAFESHADESWVWKPFSLDGNFQVSHMTRAFVESILLNNICELPTLEEVHLAHSFLLGTLQPVFNTLLNQESKDCPVT
ncbi:MAG: Gfo/Idh/MocA family oxidoreductase [Deltaproteobacteria bacterium]|nr:Gfo/Idh/MocA family oxidoreductase [Deltaproteobacteria bacterium]